ncbi:hypothetical protein, partial [Bradyrhizobium sp.]|uniref:hypothetical protein n=1 Tax=Bradyrhizobium sp. TaxID=376 RepID=UPI0025BC0B40
PTQELSNLDRINAHDSEQKAWPSSAHVASAISHKIEIHGESARAAPPHVARGHFDAAKTCKNQCADKPLRPTGASER